MNEYNSVLTYHIIPRAVREIQFNNDLNFK